jgi:hypothetical protein
MEWRCGCIFLDFGTGWSRRVVSFTPLPFYFLGKDLQYLLGEEAGGAPEAVWALLGIEPAPTSPYPIAKSTEPYHLPLHIFLGSVTEAGRIASNGRMMLNVEPEGVGKEPIVT